MILSLFSGEVHVLLWVEFFNFDFFLYCTGSHMLRITCLDVAVESKCANSKS